MDNKNTNDSREINTAQPHLEEMLDKLDNNIEELNINENLYGDIDFSILKEKGYRRIKSIIFKEGNITAIVNLPGNLEKLVCDKQQLKEMENLPDSLIELICSNNNLISIDVANLDKLKILNISNNKITELNNIPYSLEELYINDNNIRIIDLKETPNLQILHTYNNKSIIIENVPPSIKDLNIDDTITQISYNNILENGSIGGAKKDKNILKIEYDEALKKYFKIKNNYKKSILKLKHKAYEKSTVKKIAKRFVSEVKEGCIYCKRPVGSLFFHKDNTYYAICGDKVNPCALNIQIYNGSCYMIENLLYEEKKFIEDIKNDIIQQKLDTIFEYITNEKSAFLFKNSMNEYNEFNKDYTLLKELYNNNYKDLTRESLINRKVEHIYKIIESIKIYINEYKNTNNHQLLKNAIEIQINELNPEITNLRILKNEINEVNEEQLNQKYIHLYKKQYIIGVPKVIKFVV